MHAHTQNRDRRTNYTLLTSALSPLVADWLRNSRHPWRVTVNHRRKQQWRRVCAHARATAFLRFRSAQPRARPVTLSWPWPTWVVTSLKWIATDVIESRVRAMNAGIASAQTFFSLEFMNLVGSFPFPCAVLCVKLHLRDGRTDGRTDAATSVRPSVCHESQRRRHGVTAALRLNESTTRDVVAVCVFVCPSVRPSLRWSLTLCDNFGMA